MVAHRRTWCEGVVTDDTYAIAELASALDTVDGTELMTQTVAAAEAKRRIMT